MGYFNKHIFINLIQLAHHPQHPTVKMPITSEAGKAFAAKYLERFAAGFAENNHLETLDVSPKSDYGFFFLVVIYESGIL
jgi:hypothetical protein